MARPTIAQTDGSHQELLEVMEVGYRHRDMLHAGQDNPA